MAVLVLVVGLGVLATTAAQSLWADDSHPLPLVANKGIVASTSVR